MKLIDQMRLVAMQCSDPWAEENFTELIDRLAASGALVPVPQGEAVPVYELGGDEILVQHDGKIYYGESDGSSFAALAETKPVFPNFEDDTIVQPVALVPITEAEV